MCEWKAVHEKCNLKQPPMRKWVTKFWCVHTAEDYASKKKKSHFQGIFNYMGNGHDIIAS